MNKYRRARERAGFTQKELSKMIGVEPSVISRYELEGESSSITPPQARRESLALACGVELDFLENNNPQLKSELTIEQRARFRKEVESLAEKYGHHPEQLMIQFGNKHPFQYLLKERWVPIVEDVYYLSKVFGTNIDEILIGEKRDNSPNEPQFRDIHDIEWDLLERDLELEVDLEGKIDKLLLDYYSTYNRDDIINAIHSYADLLSKRGLIELLRVVQSWDDSERWRRGEEQKTSQAEKPETKE